MGPEEVPVRKIGSSGGAQEQQVDIQIPFAFLYDVVVAQDIANVLSKI